LTLDDLRKSHIIVTDWCCMRKKSRGPINHLLLHCEVALIFSLFEIRVSYASMGGGIVG
jgi:hypothetical protein